MGHFGWKVNNHHGKKKTNEKMSELICIIGCIRSLQVSSSRVNMNWTVGRASAYSDFSGSFMFAKQKKEKKSQLFVFRK